MNVFIGLLCGAASLVLMAAVAWMNYRFMSRLGASEFDGQVLGVASIAVDVMLGLLGPLIMWGLAHGRRLYVWGAVSVVSCFAILSFVSALGFAAEGRDGATTRRETERLAVNAAQRRLESLQETRKRLGTPRPSAVIEAELAGLRADRRWVVSKQCTVVRQDQLGQWCQSAHKLNAEQAVAKETERLESEIRTATAELLSARQASGHGLLDAQIALIVEGTGWAEAKVRVGLLLLAAFVMQLGAGFGVALGVAPLQAYLEEKKRQRLSKPNVGEHFSWGEAVSTVQANEVPKTMDGGISAAEKTVKKGTQRRRRTDRGIH